MSASHLRAALELVRPLNILLTFGSVLLGGWIAGDELTSSLILAALSASAIAAGGYAHNDVHDLEVARISHRARPIPSGQISGRAATWISVGCDRSGLGLTILLSPLCQAAALAILISLILYNQILKTQPLVGNALVGLIGGAPFVYGGFAVHHWSPSLLPGALAALFHFTREIVKDLQDVDGDAVHSAHTLAIWLGARGTQAIISLLLLILVIAIPLPAFLGMVGSGYLLVSLPLCGLLLLTLVTVLQADTHQDLAFPSRLLKAGMLVGILAFLVDRLFVS